MSGHPPGVVAAKYTCPALTHVYSVLAVCLFCLPHFVSTTIDNGKLFVLHLLGCCNTTLDKRFACAICFILYPQPKTVENLLYCTSHVAATPHWITSCIEVKHSMHDPLVLTQCNLVAKSNGAQTSGEAVAAAPLTSCQYLAEHLQTPLQGPDDEPR